MNDDKKLSGSRRIIFPALIAIFCLALLLLTYCLMTLVRGLELYAEVKRQPEPMTNMGRYIGQAYEIAPALGPVPIANANGVFLIPKGEGIPFHHDDEGLRVPSGVKHAFQGQRHPRLLFLGDSFTYGALVKAEDSFAFRSGLKLQGEALNAGVPGHGLGQIVLRARKLVPRYKPDYVVVQYSPWLATRAQTEFAQDSSGMVMAPYFFDGEGGMAISPAAFAPPPTLISRVEEYKTSQPGFFDRLSFLGRVAFPFFTHRDAHLAVFRLRQRLGLAPKPSARTGEIIRAAYAEIDAVSRKNGARMVILVLGTAGPLEVPEVLFPPGVAGIHGWWAQVSRLTPPSQDEYVRQYFHWRGDPPEPVDWHPNERAHAVIADAVAERIALLEKQGR